MTLLMIATLILLLPLPSTDDIFRVRVGAEDIPPLYAGGASFVRVTVLVLYLSIGLHRRFNLTPQGNADAAWHFRFSCNRTQPVLSGVMHVQPLSVSVKMAVSWLMFTTPSVSYSSDFFFLDCQTYVFGQNLRKTYVNVKH